MAAQDVLRNVAAALYYQEVAACKDIVHIPHPLRGSFTSYASQFPPAEGTAALGHHLVRRTEAIQSVRNQRVNHDIGFGLLDVAVPFVLAMVLKRAGTPQEIIPEALKLREDPQVCRYRRWLGRLAGAASSANLNRIKGSLADIEAILQDGSPTPTDVAPDELVNMGVNLGVV
ncbi:hypothetical protein [Streptomyces sp. NPDC020607]|uniref:hypothetical protein n=1 Tax=Streptomyces sp. NPDC020607 TaxID=3365082 RepID=UPI00379D06F8